MVFVVVEFSLSRPVREMAAPVILKTVDRIDTEAFFKGVKQFVEKGPPPVPVR